jgi:predicted secreted protein
MKRFLVLVMISILAVCLISGCAGGGGGATTYTDATKTITTGVNQEFVIALDHDPTTTYDWEETHDASMLDLVAKESIPIDEAKSLVKDTGTQSFRFKALNTGKTKITFLYKRPWELLPISQLTFNIDIQ